MWDSECFPRTLQHKARQEPNLQSPIRGLSLKYLCNIVFFFIILQFNYLTSVLLENFCWGKLQSLFVFHHLCVEYDFSQMTLTLFQFLSATAASSVEINEFWVGLFFSAIPPKALSKAPDDTLFVFILW